MKRLDEFLSALLHGSVLFLVGCVFVAQTVEAASCSRPMRPSCTNDSAYCQNAWRDYENAMERYADCVDRDSDDRKPGHRNPNGNGLQYWQD